MRRTAIAAAAALALAVQCAAPVPARADNPMGYRLLGPSEASSLPRRGGALGMNIESAQEITDSGMTFDLIRVRQVRAGSAGAQAGLNPGDEIIALDGRVFANMAGFAAYVGSRPPGTPVTIDYIPAGGGPAQAQRVTATIGGAGQGAGQSAAASPSQGGMSTRMKIGLGAAALLGCYELGCFSSRHPAAPQASPQ